MINARKTIAAAVVATLGAGIASIPTPAAAWGYHHWGWGWGAGAAAAGLALGAAAAAASAPYYYGYGACVLTRQPIVDIYGQVIGYRHVRVCN